jgi:hypothetical protein
MASHHAQKIFSLCSKMEQSAFQEMEKWARHSAEVSATKTKN